MKLFQLLPCNSRLDFPFKIYSFYKCGTGFYRVNYDLTTWRLLVEQLQRDHLIFPESNRAQLLDDAFNLAKSGAAFTIFIYR